MEEYFLAIVGNERVCAHDCAQCEKMRSNHGLIQRLVELLALRRALLLAATHEQEHRGGEREAANRIRDVRRDGGCVEGGVHLSQIGGAIFVFKLSRLFSSHKKNVGGWAKGEVIYYQ